MDARWRALVTAGGALFSLLTPRASVRAWSGMRGRRRPGRACLAPLLMVALVLSVVMGGRTLFWCPWMQQLHGHCCCAQSSQAHGAPAIERAPCCEARTYPACQVGRSDAGGAAQHALGGALVTVLTSLDAALPARGCTLAARGYERRARAGPDLPLYALNCTYLI